jgi:hypothetical protein
LLLYAPHLFWQYEHGFPSIKFHISERFDSKYKLSFTTDFVFVQIIFAGVFSGVVLFFSAIKYRISNSFDRALKINFIGIFVLFLLSTLRGRVEANWTAAGFIPVIVLSYQHIATNKKLRKLFFFPALITSIVIFGLRIYMFYGPLPERIYLVNEIHGWKEWAQQIKHIAGDKPVVFSNSYQHASKYTWFTHEPSYTLNDVTYRRSQYELWGTDSLFQGMEIMLVVNYIHPKYQKISTFVGEMSYKIIEGYYSYDQIHIEPSEKKYFAHSNDTIEVQIEITNRGWNVNFNANSNSRVRLNAVAQKDGKIFMNTIIDSLGIQHLKCGESYLQITKIPIALEAGNYNMMISLKTGSLFAGLQGEYVTLEVK